MSMIQPSVVECMTLTYSRRECAYVAGTAICGELQPSCSGSLCGLCVGDSRTVLAVTAGLSDRLSGPPSDLVRGCVGLCLMCRAVSVCV